MKLHGLVPNFYIHVSGSNLFISMIGLIWNLYFPLLCERTLGVEKVGGFEPNSHWASFEKSWRISRKVGGFLEQLADLG
jgi:hypothetical protein